MKLVRNMVGITELDLTDNIDKTYLGEIIEDLPHNCFFNKVLCGAGGTHLALSNKENYIILSPTTDLIKSKESAEGTLPYECLFVYGNLSTNEIVDYINRVSASGLVGKIMCTYHSLPKLIESFHISVEDTINYRLLIDEAHMLTEGDDKDFMHSEISYVLGNYKGFKSYCFMTATPFPRECFPTQISDIDLVVAKWNEALITPAKVQAQHITTRFNDYVLNIAIEHISGKRVGNAYFFYNSVEEILKVCKKLVKAKIITVEEIRVVCAESNELYVQKVMGKNFKIKNVSDSPHKINFLTSKCFEGCDILDIDGVTYVCADGKKKHTRVEIHTKVPQIVNRIRNSRYKSTVNLLYSKSYIGTGMDKEAYLKHSENEFSKAQQILGFIDNMTIELEKTRSVEEVEAMVKPHRDVLEWNQYITTDYVTGRLIPNLNYAKRSIALWESANVTYSVMRDDNNIDRVNVRSPLIEIMNEENILEHFTLPTGLDKVRVLGRKALFTEVCKDFIACYLSGDAESLKSCCEYDDIFSDFKRLLDDGDLSVPEVEGILKRNRYVKKDLSLFLNENFSGEAPEKGLYSIGVKDLSLYFKVGERYSLKDIKVKLKNLYIGVGESKTPVATDISRWYTVKKVSDRYVGHGYEIVGEKE